MIPTKEGPGVTGKGMVAVAVPGTGHGAQRAARNGQAKKPDARTPNEPARNRPRLVTLQG